jgi:DNA repair protein RecO (recombination protein O)
MAVVTTDALILQAFKYSDTSKILRLLTRSSGLQSVIAKGALRPKSPFGGVLEPFTEGSATYFFKDGRDLHTLTSFELARSRQRLGSSLIHFGGASLIAELVLRSGIEEADADLFETVSAALDHIQEATSAQVEAAVLGETWALIAQLGFAPALEQCIGCGRSIEPHEEVSFDYAAGGIRCTSCAAGMPGRVLPPHARTALMSLMQGQHVDLERTSAHWRLLARFLAHHVLDGATLKSLAFLAESLEEAE